MYYLVYQWISPRKKVRYKPRTLLASVTKLRLVSKCIFSHLDPKPEEKKPKTETKETTQSPESKLSDVQKEVLKSHVLCHS